MKEIGFSLKGLFTEEFATNKTEIEDNDTSSVNISLGVGFGIKQDEKVLGCFVDIKYEYEKIPIIILKLNCEFFIKKESWEQFISDSKIIVKKDFLCYLASIAVGAARGIIHAKTEGTSFNKFYLPTLNVTDIITKDEEFPLKEEN